MQGISLPKEALELPIGAKMVKKCLYIILQISSDKIPDASDGGGL